MDNVRAKRLASDFRKIKALESESDIFKIEHTRGDPPEFYVVRFLCKGIVRLNSGEPVIREGHLVEIHLPHDYPKKAPLLRWLTPSFHPNVSREGTGVCIDVWYPSKFLDDLCIMLARMIQYHNYNPDPKDCLRRDAAEWARENRHRFPVEHRSLRRGQKIGDVDEPDRIIIIE